ncbi:MAG: restriction endonuclease subunit S, partial [Defluviitaleaceae bacterium]|nr:restriction endonuclease subunit S [Defluviitaleaceae bacterium]
FDINSSADASFLLERFLQRSFYEFEGNLANGSRKAKRINQEDFLDMQITAPCKKEQVAIGNFFRNLDNQITTQTQKLEQLKQLKAAYLQKMFV